MSSGIISGYAISSTPTIAEKTATERCQSQDQFCTAARMERSYVFIPHPHQRQHSLIFMISNWMTNFSGTGSSPSGKNYPAGTDNCCSAT